MQTPKSPAPPPARTHAAVLVQSRRITPPASREEVRHLVFRTGDQSFDGALGNCIRVMAPGQYGNPWHTRLYSIMDLERSDKGTALHISNYFPNPFRKYPTVLLLHSSKILSYQSEY